MARIFLILIFCISQLAADEPAPKKQTVCLNMIVKNEKGVIRRCLDSVKPLIDYWVIVDTGSDDGTQEIIKKHMKGIPGELHERPWRNFGENRSEAYNLARGKGDYILFMDADDTLDYEKGFRFKNLTKDCYNMWRGIETLSYIKPQLVKGDLRWKWVGVTHEYLGCDKYFTSETLKGVFYTTREGGADSLVPKKKFHRDIKLLTAGLKTEPKNDRYMFYLAESYRFADEKGKAIEWYQKRVNAGGWDEEIFWSKLQIAQLLSDLDLPKSIVIEAYKNAHAYRPHRMEPVYYLSELYNSQGQHSKAYELVKAQAFIPKPAEKDSLFNMDWIEQYGLLFQLSISAYYVGNYQESLDACKKLLQMKNLPEEWRNQAEINRSYPLARLEKK